MSFQLRTYYPPDFQEEKFQKAPQARMEPAQFDAVAPLDFHAMSIFPELRSMESGFLQRTAGWTACRCMRTVRLWSVSPDS